MGHIINGQFDGSFSAFGETFHLEPVQRYSSLKANKFHSIIFPSSSVQFDLSKIERQTAHFNNLHLSVAKVSGVIKLQLTRKALLSGHFLYFTLI